MSASFDQAAALASAPDQAPQRQRWVGQRRGKDPGGSASELPDKRAPRVRRYRLGAAARKSWGWRSAVSVPPTPRKRESDCVQGVCVCVCKQARQELLCSLVSPRDPRVQEDHPKRPGVIDRVPLGAPGESIFQLTWRRTDGSHSRPSSVPKRFSFAICPFILRSSSPAPTPV